MRSSKRVSARSTAVGTGILVTELPGVEKGWVSPPEDPGLGTALVPNVWSRPDAVVATSQLDS